MTEQTETVERKRDDALLSMKASNSETGVNDLFAHLRFGFLSSTLFLQQFNVSLRETKRIMRNTLRDFSMNNCGEVLITMRFASFSCKLVISSFKLDRPACWR